MPQGWIHATIDLLVYGRSYFWIHKNKDKAWKKLGRRHRKIQHPYYWCFNRKWNFQKPFPKWIKKKVEEIKEANEKEKFMAKTDHDYNDRVWDSLTLQERIYREAFFIWILKHPEIIKNWAKVDVIKGKIHRVIDGKEIWEDSPETKKDYEVLLRYIKPIEENEEVKLVLRKYGENNKPTGCYLKN